MTKQNTDEIEKIINETPYGWNTGEGIKAIEHFKEALKMHLKRKSQTEIDRAIDFYNLSGKSQTPQEATKEKALKPRVYATTETLRGYVKIEDVEKLIDELEEHYSVDIFPRIFLREDETKRLNDFCKKEFGFPLDSLSAELMRRATENTKNELKQRLKEIGRKT